MTELERALVQLGGELALPEAPDVSGRVLARLAAEPAPPRRVRNRRALVIALAVLAVVVAAAMAVPQARTAILEFFHLRGATVQRVEKLPTLPRPTADVLDLGRPVPLGKGGVPNVTIPEVLVPSALGAPDAAYMSREVYGSRLNLVYEPGDGIPKSLFDGVGILVSEFVGEADRGWVEKLVDGGVTVQRLRVGPYPALWFEGGPHAVLFLGEGGSTFEDRGRLAGNTLLVQRNDVLVRIEGELSRERAIEIAESLQSSLPR